MGLFAHKSYVARHGLPANLEGLGEYHFVGPDGANARAPHNAWLAANVPDEAVVFRSNEAQSLQEAVRQGIGIGFLPLMGIRSDYGLVEVVPPRADWRAALWLVTHVDLHRTAKVQAFTEFLKQKAADWR